MIYFKVHKENFALLRLSNNQNNIVFLILSGLFNFYVVIF